MEPVMMDQAELKAMKDDMKKAVETNDGLKRELEVVRRERDQAREVANRAKGEADRFRKMAPEDKVLDENKGLRTAVSETQKKLSVLEKELVVVKAESEGRRKEVERVNRKFDNVQNTFDTLQVGRDRACVERDKALVELQTAADAYSKLREEFEAFKKAASEKESNEKRPAKVAAKPEPVKA